MSHPSFQVPEPRGPEHQLIADAGELPTLSSGLRERVLIDCHRQVRLGRNADRLRIVGAVVAASLFVGLVWHFRWTGQSDAERSGSSTADQVLPAPVIPPYQSPGEMQLADPSQQPQLPQGGPPSKNRESLPEMQQFNQLIDELNQRQNILCSLLPYRN